MSTTEQTKGAEKGPIYHHMHRDDDPLAQLSHQVWTCSSTDQLGSMNQFHESFNRESQCLIAQGGQASIFSLNASKSNKSSPPLVVAKYYMLSKRADALQSVWTEYMFIKHTKLLHYDQIYYDERRGEAVIISEPLDYTLRQYVDTNNRNINHNISESECKLITLQLLRQLWTTHRCGFVHNDLNPDNVMYRGGDVYNNNNNDSISAGCWKIIDYGLMTSVKGGNRRQTYQGTRGWTPPETVPECQSNAVSAAKDIWGLGLLIVYMLCKTHPYLMSSQEQQELCQADRAQYKPYFYYNKLLQQPHKKKKSGKPLKLKRLMLRGLKGADTAVGVANEHKAKKMVVGAEKLDFTAGEAHLKKHLMKLYADGVISYELCNLLINYMLNFDASRRFNCAQIYNHKWFDDVRHL